jgi:WS/DGAT/MGAT family acyltransferase
MSNTTGRIKGSLTDTDTLLWTIGRDPVLRTTIVAVLILDRAPRWKDLQGRMRALTDALPRLRSRVEPASPLRPGRPRWVEDTGFDLDVHLRRMVAPPPATLRTVLDLAQVMGTTAFDPELPLWEAVVVEGIDGGQAALVIKLHHAVVDGVGGIAWILGLLDRTRAPRHRHAAGPAASGMFDQPDDGAVSGADGPGSRIARLARIVPASRRALEAAGRAAADPVAQVKRARATAESVGRLLAPAGRPLSPLMTTRSMGRRFEVVDLSGDLLHETAAASGVTMNDVFVAGILGGLHRYHRDHGFDTDQLRVLMPVNVRNGRDAAGGNHFVPARFVLPAGADPAECLRRVHSVAGSWKNAPGLGMSDVLAAALNVLPPAMTTVLWGSMLKGDDFVATNVPGPPFETYLSGAHVERLYAFAPTSGAALNVALVTPAGRACVGINLDTAAVPDGAALARCLEKGFHDVFVTVHGRPREATA